MTTHPILAAATEITSSLPNKLNVVGQFPLDEPRVFRLPEGVTGTVNADGSFRLRVRVPLTAALAVTGLSKREAAPRA